MRKLLLAIVLVLVLAGQGWADDTGTDHYVDCDLTTGNNDGNGVANAFKTLEAAEAHFQSDQSGAWCGLADHTGADLFLEKDTVCTYNTAAGNWGDSYRFTNNWGGNSTNDYGYIGCYENATAGDWCEAGEYAIIDGSKSDWSSGCTSNQCIDLVTLTKSYIRMKNIKIQNAAGQGIVIDNAGSGSEVTDVIIEYSYAYNTGKTGIYDYDPWEGGCSATHYHNSNITIRNNHLEQTGECHRAYRGACGAACSECSGFPQAIQVGGGDNITVEYNYIRNSFGEGIITFSNPSDTGPTIIQNNHIESTAASCIGLYQGDNIIVRYNVCIGYTDGTNYQYNQNHACNSGESSRNWNVGIQISPHMDQSMDTLYIYGNIVHGARYGIKFTTSYPNECADIDEAVTSYVYNNQFIDNCHQWWTGNAAGHTVTAKNNITYCYQARCEDVYEPIQLSSLTADYNLWTSNPAIGARIKSDWDGANDCDACNPYVPNFTGDPAGVLDNWQDIDARGDYTTADMNISNSSEAISEGVDLGDTATCADDDNLGYNCGLSITTDDVDFHDLPNTITFDWVDQGDNSVDIGPWTYTEEDPEQPADKVAVGGD